MTNRVLGYGHSETRWLEARRGQLVKKFDGIYEGRKTAIQTEARVTTEF